MATHHPKDLGFHEFLGRAARYLPLRLQKFELQTIPPAKRIQITPEPWYILTNDLRSSRTKIARIYYHRFEIEETFKDMKHIFELKRTSLNKPLSLKLLLWFVSLGIALLYTVTKPAQPKRPVPGQRGKAHSKKQISWLRQAYEELQQGCALLVWGGG